MIKFHASRVLVEAYFMVGTRETGDELVEILEKAGYFKTSRLVKELLRNEVLIRLKEISYLSSIPYAFPEIEDFSRWDHSIGTAELIARVLTSKGVDEPDLMSVVVAGLLHDVGNVFFSHVGEAVVKELHNLDQDKLREQVVKSAELKEIFDKYDIDHWRIRQPPYKYQILFKSHFDCDTLDGISRTARTLGWDVTDWASVLPQVTDIVDDDLVWKPEALPYLKAQWELKKRVYDEYVYSSRNQACEVMLEHMLHLVDIQDVWMSENEVLAAAKAHPKASQILDMLRSGQVYDLMYLDDVFKNDEGKQRFVMFRAGMLKRVSEDDFLVFSKPSTKKVFGEWSLEPEGEGSLRWRELEAELKEHYQTKTRYLLGAHQIEGTNSVIEGCLEEFKEKYEIPIKFVSIFEWMGSKTYPLGLLTLATILEQNLFSNLSYLEYTMKYTEKDYPTQSFDWFFSQPDPWKTQYLIFDNFSDYVEYFESLGNSPMIMIGPVFTCYLQELMFLSTKIRQSRPDAIILAGGPHFGLVSDMDIELLTRCEEIDGFVIGEAEETIVDIMEVRVKHGARESFLKAVKDELIQGLLVRNGTFSPREEIRDLESIPIPDLDLLHTSNPLFVYSLSDRRNPYQMTHHGYIEDAYGGGSTADDMFLFGDLIHARGHRDRFDGQSYSLKIGFGVISGSRGCPFNCSFCASHGVRRIRSAQHIFDEMQLVHKHFNIDLFVFFDPLFTTSSPEEKKRVEELCDLLLYSGLSTSIDFQIEIRADVILRLDEPLLVKMIQAGCRVMNLGLEKGSDTALSRIDKKMKLSDHAVAIQKVRDAVEKAGGDVLINGTFIMGGPEETPQDIKDTVVHAFSLDLDALAIFPLEVHPATTDYKDALERGVIEPGLRPYLNLKRYPLFHSKSVSQELLCDLNTAMMAVFHDLKRVRDEVNTLGTEQKRNLPRIKEIVGFSVDDWDKNLSLSDRYARWFLKLLKREIAQSWLNGKKVSTLEDVLEVKKEINRLESELNSIRPKDHEYHTGNYSDGNLARECNQFLSAFKEFVEILGPT